MRMSSYDVVRRAIEFQNPDRLPILIEGIGPSDVHTVRWNQIGTGDNSLRETVDEWGCTWTRSEVKNMGLVTGHPLEDWDSIDDFSWPDPDNPELYEGMEERFKDSDGKYVRTNLFMLLFERIHSLRGFENTLTDFYLERERIIKLADRIVEYDLGIIRNIAQRFPGRIHGMIFSDDWGTQQNLIINPEMWRKFFKSRYKSIFDAIHQVGWHAWMHSCGRINDIIGDLIEIGVDTLNIQQPRVLGIEEIGQKFRGQICFVSLCDIQQTLPFKDDYQIINEAKLLLEHWAAPNGGFILDDYPDEEELTLDVGKKRIMLDAFLNLDPWSKY